MKDLQHTLFFLQ